MPFNPPKLKGLPGAAPPRRVGGYLGDPGRSGRPGRPGISGRGNANGAGPRPDGVADDFNVIDFLDSIPELIPITVVDGPTYSESLQAHQGPLWTELLLTPTGPVHPQDCALWPDSPFCGGSAIEPGNIGGLGLIGLAPEVVVSDTEIIVQIHPSALWVNLPPLQIGIRAPWAEAPGSWGPPIETPVGGISHFGGPGSTVKWLRFSETWVQGSSPERPEVDENKLAIVHRMSPPGAYPTLFGGTIQVLWTFAAQSTDVAQNVSIARQTIAFYNGNPPDNLLTIGYWTTSLTLYEEAWIYGLTTEPPYEDLAHNLDYYREYRTNISVTNRFTGQLVSIGYVSARQGVSPARVTGIPINPPIPPPPPPILPPRSPARQPEDPMACDCKKLEKLLKEIKALLDHEGQGEIDLTPCQEGNNQPEQELAQWEGKGLAGVFSGLKALSQAQGANYEAAKCVPIVLGVDKLPWELPANLGTGKGEETINNYAELQIYNFKQLSNLLGQTEIEIKVQDSSLTQSGDQELTLKFANLSEAIAEIAGLSISNQTLASATLKAAMTAVVQAGMASTSAATAAQHVEEIQDFLGYQVKRDSFDMPLAYTPGETSPDKMLKESVVKVGYWNNIDPQNLQSFMTTAEFAFALIRAAFYERIGDNSDGPGTIKDRIRETDSAPGSDFDTFLERVERGYTDAAGSTDVNPYGRDFSERPRIRKIGGTNEDDGSNT